MAMYSIGDLGRRELLKMSAVIAGLGTVAASKAAAAANTELQRTPGQILGPFYPLTELPQSADLTRVPGRPGRAEGQVLNVMGQVLNLAGEPVRNAKITRRTLSSGSAIAASRGKPSTRSWTRASYRPPLTAPTLKPKLRSVPRKSDSTSSSLR